MGRVVALCFASALLLAGGALAWILFLATPPPPDEPRWVQIPSGASTDGVADSLIAQGLLENRQAFVLPARVSGWGEQIKAGCYQFEQASSVYRTLKRLRAGEQTAVRVRIPSGSRPHFVARSAARHMFFDEGTFLAALTDSTLASSLNTDTLHLFSYMLPNTYRFYCTTTAEAVITRIKGITDELFADRLQALGASNGLSQDEVINLAAIVEWETRVDEEKARVAGVYLNRLKKRWPLQADPTIQYALIELEGGKRRLLFVDYRLEHPYNTYLFQGFPPGPITNPGRASLEAAANPEAHEYMFFVANPQGTHTFSVTLREHNRAAARLRAYLRQQRARQAD